MSVIVMDDDEDVKRLKGLDISAHSSVILV